MGCPWIVIPARMRDTGEESDLEGWGNRYTFPTPPGWELYDLRQKIGEIDEQFPVIQRVIDKHWND